MLGLSRGQLIILIGTLVLLAVSPFVIYFINRYRQDVRSRADEERDTLDEPSFPGGEFGKLTDFEPTPATGSAPKSLPASGDTTLRFVVQLEGRREGDMSGEMFIGVAAIEGSPPTYVQTGSKTSTPQGIVEGYTLTSLTLGRTYVAYLKGPQHLSSSKTFLLQSGVNNLGDNPILMLAGDLNADNVIDAFDSGLLEAAFSSTPTAQNWNPMADLNNDQVVNNIDRSLLAKNFGRTGSGGAWYSPTGTPSAN